MGINKKRNNKRKVKLFSVSFRLDDLIELEKYLESTGSELSRNELIRRSVLAHVRFEQDGNGLTYEDIFKNIN